MGPLEVLDFLSVFRTYILFFSYIFLRRGLLLFCVVFLGGCFFVCVFIFCRELVG